MNRLPILPLMAILAASTACTVTNDAADSSNAAANPAVANAATTNASATPDANNAAPTNELSGNMAAPSVVNGQVLRLTGGGLATASPGLHSSGQLTFGQTRDEVLASITAIRGQPTDKGRNEDCPTGAVDFASFGPLDLHFQNNRFVGWVMDGPATPPIEEEYGLRIGWTRTDLQESDQGPPTFKTSSLGQEFDFNGIGGLLDGPGRNAKVTTLFSGVTCFAR
jgi:hypothetical protein